MFALKIIIQYVYLLEYSAILFSVVNLCITISSFLKYTYTTEQHALVAYVPYPNFI